MLPRIIPLLTKKRKIRNVLSEQDSTLDISIGAGNWLNVRNSLSNDRTSKIDGVGSIKLVADGTGSSYCRIINIPVTAGLEYGLSAKCKLGVGNIPVFPQIIYLDSGSNVITYYNGGDTYPSSEVQNVFLSKIAPTNTVKANIVLATNGTPQSGDTVYWDSILFGEYR